MPADSSDSCEQNVQNHARLTDYEHGNIFFKSDKTNKRDEKRALDFIADKKKSNNHIFASSMKL